MTLIVFMLIREYDINGVHCKDYTILTANPDLNSLFIDILLLLAFFASRSTLLVTITTIGVTRNLMVGDVANSAFHPFGVGK